MVGYFILAYYYMIVFKYDKFYIPSQYWEFQIASSTITFQFLNSY